MSGKCLLTIFTPAYNRAHTLPRTYRSLLGQKNKNFIWLIVDDGSSDNTADLVYAWKRQNNGFEIRYIYKENGGMHTAHNVAYDNIDTELNMCIDSDDCLANEAIEKIYRKWDVVKKNNYAGIIGLDADFNGKIIGKGFPKGMKETTLMEYYASGGMGDKKLVYRTDVIKRYPPYPTFPEENYVALGYKYRLIDQDYKLAVLDEILCNVEYQMDGSSATMWKQYVKNPKGFAFWRKICMKYPMSRKRLWIDCIHYVSENIISGDYGFIKDSPKKGMTILAVPFGIALSVYTKYKANSFR